MNQIIKNNNPGDKQASYRKKHAGVIADVKQWTFIKQKYRMTNREIQIAILTCRDFDNEKIAQLLNIGVNTVKTHLRNIYRKTHVRKKLSLLLRFMDDIKEAGMMPPSIMSSMDDTEIKSRLPFHGRQSSQKR